MEIRSECKSQNGFKLQIDIVCKSHFGWKKYQEQYFLIQVSRTSGNISWTKNMLRQTVETVVNQRPAANCGTLQGSHRVLTWHCMVSLVGHDPGKWVLIHALRLPYHACCLQPYLILLLALFLPDCPLRSWLIGGPGKKRAHSLQSSAGWALCKIVTL